MGFFSRNGVEKSSISESESGYPLRTHKKVLCTKKHCTDACTKTCDIYKYWAIFLAENKINQEELFRNIIHLPERLRIAVYIKCVGRMLYLEPGEYTNYLKNCKQQINSEKDIKIDFNDLNLDKPIKEDSSKNSEITDNTGLEIDKDVLDQIESDRFLVDKIFKLCSKFQFYDEGTIFDIYKKLGKDFKVNEWTLKLIFSFLKMENSTTDSVYTIINHLYKNFDLEGAFISLADENTLNNMDSNQRVQTESDVVNPINENCEKNENSSANKSSGVADKNFTELDSSEADLLNTRIDKSAKDYTEVFNRTFNMDKNNKPQKTPTEINFNELFSKVLNSEFQLFKLLTDMVFATNMSYIEIVKEASYISKFFETNDLLKVLRATSNIKYYTVKDKKESKRITNPEPRYFDFLVIQNELIKAQENIKAELSDEINSLNEEIGRLKVNNEMNTEPLNE